MSRDIATALSLLAFILWVATTIYFLICLVRPTGFIKTRLRALIGLPVSVAIFALVFISIIFIKNASESGVNLQDNSLVSTKLESTPRTSGEVASNGNDPINLDELSPTDAEEQYKLGLIYYSIANSVSPNALEPGVRAKAIESAFHWLGSSAEQGFVPAQIKLGDWYRLAATLGHEQELRRLQRMHRDGLIID